MAQFLLRPQLIDFIERAIKNFPGFEMKSIKISWNLYFQPEILHPLSSPYGSPSLFAIWFTLSLRHMVHPLSSPYDSPSLFAIWFTLSLRHMVHPLSSPYGSPSLFAIWLLLTHIVRSSANVDKKVFFLILRRIDTDKTR